MVAMMIISVEGPSSAVFLLDRLGIQARSTSSIWGRDVSRTRRALLAGKRPCSIVLAYITGLSSVVIYECHQVPGRRSSHSRLGVSSHRWWNLVRVV